MDNDSFKLSHEYGRVHVLVCEIILTLCAQPPQVVLEEYCLKTLVYSRWMSSIVETDEIIDEMLCGTLRLMCQCGDIHLAE